MGKKVTDELAFEDMFGWQENWVSASSISIAFFLALR